MKSTNWMKQIIAGSIKTILQVLEVRASESFSNGINSPEAFPMNIPDTAPNWVIAPNDPEIDLGANSDI